ncbi:AbrB/MazE/SpoVT family DNA-binding domain-containing protein [Spectribacter hydrogenoxidans]|uniref:AbrB/MazE/SpoVT family DNA-binding domain-containing protein n=1 Tax=Spectribacter hydrogenoxidans TaxID=3075608 RepID=A0ABU3C0E2_9GAMM|nr:AbrB/MazE/SpoVT family DNA-binding domain-containing protein [Salinisphaera sp. W335]MDT0635021.1 AbrB/MazE/SpoVT family DNA-binding domain-containing protein [Salinisphaera sp. W335]
MRVTSKGQVTIPVHIRRRLGLEHDSDVEFVIDGGQVILRRATGSTRGADLVAQMRGRADVPMSTDEIMALTRGN